MNVHPKITFDDIDLRFRDDVDPWLKSAHPGERACYFIGHLSENRSFAPGYDRIERLAHTLHRLSIAGRVFLAQERISHRDGFRYLVIKAHRKQTAEQMVREEREPPERKKRKYESFGPMAERIIDAHKAHPGRTNLELAKLTGSTYGGVATTLSNARKKGLL